MTGTNVRAIDAWAQPAFTGMRESLPEIVRLFEKSGSANLLDQGLEPAQIVELMDAAGVDKLMICAWCRPGRWARCGPAIRNR